MGTAGTMKHIPCCKIKQDFDFPGGPSCIVEMWGRSVLSNASPSMGRTPQDICLAPLQSRASNKGITEQNVSHRCPSLLGWKVISLLPLTTANYVCWSNCSTCLQFVIASFERNALLHWTEMDWKLQLQKMELNNLSWLTSIQSFHSCTHSLRGLDSISHSATPEVPWQHSVEFTGCSTMAKWYNSAGNHSHMVKCCWKIVART